MGAVLYLAVLTTVLASPAAVALGYNTRYLMPASGDLRCTPVSINSSGQVLGESTNYDTSYRAFVWEPSGGMTFVADLDYGGNCGSINDYGEVCGSCWGHGTGTPFYWKQTTGRMDLNSGGMLSATMISNSGLILGTSADHVRTVYDSHGNPVQTLSGGSRINDDGVVAGYYYSSVSRAATWGTDGSMRLLEMPNGMITSSGYDINDGGWVVGTARVGEKSNFSTPVVWNPAGTPTILSMPGMSGRADAIDNLGNIAGWVEGADGERHAVLWDVSGTIIADLGYGRAIDVSNGHYILGYSGPDTASIPTVWTLVPEPTSLLALTAGIGGFCAYRRRQR